MEPDFSKLFHEASKDRGRGHPPIPDDPSEWPAAWKEIAFKEYPRLPSVRLPDAHFSADLKQTIFNRTSRRDFTGAPLTLAHYSSLLGYSCGAMSGERHRAQPSGGARFPVETYAIVFHGPSTSSGQATVSEGVYHYNVKRHALETLWKRAFSPADANALCAPSWAKNVSALLVLTAVFSHTKMKYGERGYRHILLEAGHIGQNVYLVSAALGLKCCAIGGTNDEAIEALLDIDPSQESVVYALAVGN